MEHVHLAVPCQDGSVVLLCVILDDDRSLKREFNPAMVEMEIAKSSTPKRNADGSMYAGWPSPPVVAENGRYAWRPLVMDEDTKAKFESPYRDALKDFGHKIDHDMDRARAVHRELLRRARAPLLADLDVRFMRATETSDTVFSKNVATAKQLLRDITKDPRIDAASSVEELATVTVDAVLQTSGQQPALVSAGLLSPDK